MNPSPASPWRYRPPDIDLHTTAGRLCYWQCNECGAMVGNTDAHDRWHAATHVTGSTHREALTDDPLPGITPQDPYQ